MILDPRDMIKIKQMIDVVNFRNDPEWIPIVERLVAIYRHYRTDLVVEWTGTEISVRSRTGEQLELNLSYAGGPS